MDFFLLTPKVRPRGICLFLANMGCGGVGWDVNVHVTLMMFYAARGGWGGVGWDVNVHVTLMMFYAARGGWGGVGC